MVQDMTFTMMLILVQTFLGHENVIHVSLQALFVWSSFRYIGKNKSKINTCVLTFIL